MNKSQKRSRQAGKLLFSVCLLLFFLSTGVLLWRWRENRRAITDFRRLAVRVEKYRTDAVKCPSLPSASPTAEEEIDVFSLLSAENADFWGWLRIEDTEVSYPVMHTPEQAEKYLRRDFFGNFSRHGTPFLDGDCTETCNHSFIYGHNMRDGTMFAPLLAYADREFYAAHPRIELETARGREVYAVMGAFFAQVYPADGSNVFRYYQYTDLSSPERFEEYIAGVTAAALYPTDVTALYGERLLTLSTCSYHTENGRFAVVAKQIE